MARPRKSFPDYPKHPHRCGQAVIRLAGVDRYLGKHGTPESRAEYDRVIAEHLLAKLRPADAGTVGGRPASVEIVLASYWEHAQATYLKCGQPTSQVQAIRAVLDPLRRLYGKLPARDFRAHHLLALREHLIRKLQWSRGTINNAVGIVKTAWDWAVCHGFVEVSGLRSVRGLRLETAGVKPNRTIRPAPWPAVQQTLPRLLPQVQDLARVQYLAGMRPCEVCGLRPIDLHLDGYADGVGRFPGCWVYEVAYRFNKNAHKGQRRIVLLGPLAQLYLTPYLAGRDPEAFLFSPREAMQARMVTLGRNPTVAGARPPGERYDTRAYCHAVKHAARRAGADHWHPNQLRHNRATEVRSLYDADHARVVLGHALPGVTGAYALADLGKAAKVMLEMG